MIRITKVQPLANWQLSVEFSDGSRGIASLKDRLFGPMFEPLRDPKLFAQASIDEFAAICWPNGADLAPDALYERLAAQNKVA
jgi:hypothetical protein